MAFQTNHLITRQSKIHENVDIFALLCGYPVQYLRLQRILGPRNGATTPEKGTEIYVANLPRLLFEDTLIPIFSNGSDNIYKFRLLLDCSGLSNRGTAYITYQTKAGADEAIMTLNKTKIYPGHDEIIVRKSIDNRRLFIGNIPEGKNKDQVWTELIRNGLTNITDVIMYQAYADKTKNRGFVFVEFATHNAAAAARAFHRDLQLFGVRAHVDWSTPLRVVDNYIMDKVKKLFIRNLHVNQPESQLAFTIRFIVGESITIQKVYKNLDYAFVHFLTRSDAEIGLIHLKEYFKNSDIEICWAKPVPPTQLSDRLSLVDISLDKKMECYCSNLKIENTPNRNIDLSPMSNPFVPRFMQTEAPADNYMQMPPPANSINVSSKAPVNAKEATYQDDLDLVDTIKYLNL